MTVFTINTNDGQYKITARYDGEQINVIRTLDQETESRAVLMPGDLDRYESELYEAAEKRQRDEMRDRNIRNGS